MSTVDQAMNKLADIVSHPPKIMSVGHSVSVAGSGNGNTNLKNKIDAVIPTGYVCGGIVGYSTNSIYIVVSNCQYSSSNYSLQWWNRTTSTQTANISIHFLVLPESWGGGN